MIKMEILREKCFIRKFMFFAKESDFTGEQAC